MQFPPSRTRLWSYRLHKCRKCFFFSSSTDVLWKQIVSQSGSLWGRTGTPALLWIPHCPFSRTQLECGVIFLYVSVPFSFFFPSLLCLHLHPFSLFIVSFFLPSSLVRCLLFGVFVSSLPSLPCFLYIFLSKPCFVSFWEGGCAFPEQWLLWLDTA